MSTQFVDNADSEKMLASESKHEPAEGVGTRSPAIPPAHHVYDSQTISDSEHQTLSEFRRVVQGHPRFVSEDPLTSYPTEVAQYQCEQCGVIWSKKHVCGTRREVKRHCLPRPYQEPR